MIPCGRGNDLARVLGIPTDPAEAARLAVEGEERLLDVANVDGTPFMGIASFGFDSDANRIANEAKLVKGNAVYLYAALRALAAWKPATFTRRSSTASATTLTRLLGRRRQLEGLRRRHVRPPRGRARRRQARRACSQGAPRSCASSREMPKVFKGTHVDSAHVEFLRGEEIEVSSDRPFVIYADGDPIGATPATMRVERRCLRVIAPS